MGFDSPLEPWRTEEGLLQTWQSSLSEDSPLRTWAVPCWKRWKSYVNGNRFNRT